MQHDDLSCDRNPCPDAFAERLGCYFCNDVVAPANSLARRSMDQQCTVVRPGLARVAAAHAVEMLAALSQYAEFGAAPVGDTSGGGVLGGVPHMLRGTFMGFEQTHMRGVATRACSACGDAVLSKYHAEGVAFVMKVLQVDPNPSDAAQLVDKQFLVALRNILLKFPEVMRAVLIGRSAILSVASLGAASFTLNHKNNRERACCRITNMWKWSAGCKICACMDTPRTQ